MACFGKTDRQHLSSMEPGELPTDSILRGPPPLTGGRRPLPGRTRALDPEDGTRGLRGADDQPAVPAPACTVRPGVIREMQRWFPGDRPRSQSWRRPGRVAQGFLSPGNPARTGFRTISRSSLKRTGEQKSRSEREG